MHIDKLLGTTAGPEQRALFVAKVFIFPLNPYISERHENVALGKVFYVRTLLTGQKM